MMRQAGEMRARRRKSDSHVGTSAGLVATRRAARSAGGTVIAIATVMRAVGPVEEAVVDETATVGASVHRARRGSVGPRAVGRDRNAVVQSVVGSVRSISAPRITMAEALAIDSALRAC